MKVKLKDLGKISTGNTPSKHISEFYNSEDIGFVKPDIISEQQIDYIENTTEYLAEAARNKARIVKKNAVFVTCIGNIGKIGIVKSKELAFNQQINAIEPNEKILSKYLAYGIFANRRRLQAISNAPVVPIINKTQFGEFEIDIIDDTKEQLKIVELLDKVSEVIVNRKEELEKLDELIKARFVEMFGDLRTNTKKWNIKTFDELSCLITDGEHDTPRRTEEGIFLLSARNVLNHSLQLDDVDYIDQEEYNRISKRVVPQEGDVLISCSGTVGRCCSVSTNLKFQMVRSVALIRFKEEINPIFAEYMITSDYLQEQIKSSKTASSQANLFQGKIKALKGFAPPVELQNEFVMFVKQVNKSKVVVQKALDETQLLFNSLMQKYFE